MDEPEDAYSSPDVVAPTPIPQLIARGRLAVIQLASYAFGIGLALVILAWANFYGPLYFTFIAAGLTVLCYAFTVFLIVRVHILRYRGAAIYMIAGVAITTLSMAFIIATDTGHWQQPGNPFAAQPAQKGPFATPSDNPDADPNQTLDQLVLPQFTTDEMMLTGAFRRTYDATGLWPASATVEAGTVVTPDGTTGIAPMNAAEVSYAPSADRKTFVLTLRASDGFSVSFDEATGIYSHSVG